MCVYDFDCLLPYQEVSEYNFNLQTDGRNYNIDVFFQSTSEWREGGERSEPSASYHNFHSQHLSSELN